MNEFEWRRQLRTLHTDVEPGPQVWAGILHRIEAGNAAAPSSFTGTAEARTRAANWPSLAAAAAVLVAFSIALVATIPRPESPGVAKSVASEATERLRAATVADQRMESQLARNPVLAATDAELRELQEQLRRALVSQPQSPRLQRMLMRTQDERRRLLQYQSQLG